MWQQIPLLLKVATNKTPGKLGSWMGEAASAYRLLLLHVWLCNFFFSASHKAPTPDSLYSAANTLGQEPATHWECGKLLRFQLVLICNFINPAQSSLSSIEPARQC
jgi:hypothetical protein